MKVNYPEIDLIHQTLTLLCAQWWISTFMVTLAVPSFHSGNDLDMNNLHCVFFHFTSSFARWFGHILKLFRVGEKNPILGRSKLSSDGTLSCSSFKNSMFPDYIFLSVRNSIKFLFRWGKGWKFTCDDRKCRKKLHLFFNA